MSTSATTMEQRGPAASGAARVCSPAARWRRNRARRHADFCGDAFLLITSLLVYELWVNSHLSRAQFGWSFFWTATWDPVFDQFRSGCRSSMARWSLRSSRWRSPYRWAWPRRFFSPNSRPANLSDTIAFLIDLLAAFPSVIYGLLGIFIVVPLMRTAIGPALKHTLGLSADFLRARTTAWDF